MVAIKKKIKQKLHREKQINKIETIHSALVCLHDFD